MRGDRPAGGRARTGGGILCPAATGLMWLLVACVLLAGCSTTTRGTGSAVGAAPSSASSSPGPSEPPTSTPSTSGSPSPPATGPGPAAVAPPASCSGGACHQDLSSSLRQPFMFIVRTNAAYNGGEGATIVELTDAGVPVYWYTIAGETPAQITCSTSADKSNCVLVDNVGAHGSNATVWRLSGATLDRGSTVLSDSPNMRALELNGDGWVDAEALQSTNQPDYASAPVYWQTWISDGTTLTSTGCTAPTRSAPPAPAAPVTGTCSH